MKKVSDFKDKKTIDKYRTRLISHKFVMQPALLRILGRVENKKILDLGCGCADLSRILAKKGAKVAAVDVSKKWIDVCKEENANFKNVECIIGDASDLKMFNDEKFDFVIMNMVFINIASKKKVEKVFKEVSRVLKKSGSFIFTDLNPVCLMKPDRVGQERKNILFPDFSYFKDGSFFESEVILINYSTIKFGDVHWTLETYVDFTNKAKMYIYKIIEPQPIKSAVKYHPKIYKNYKIPEYIIFHCKKLPK